MKSILEFLFTFKGRINRLKFFVWQTLLSMPVIIYMYYINNDIGQEALMLLLLPLILLCIVSLFSFTVRRLHDLNLSGWFIFIIYIPYIGFAFSCLLLIKKGKSNGNKYDRGIEIKANM